MYVCIKPLEPPAKIDWNDRNRFNFYIFDVYTVYRLLVAIIRDLPTIYVPEHLNPRLEHGGGSLSCHEE